jgi:hypothetical protein
VKKETQQPWGVGLITWSVDRSVVELVLVYQPHAVMLSFGDPRPYVSAINVRKLSKVQSGFAHDHDGEGEDRERDRVKDNA